MVADLIQFTATDAEGSAIWLDPAEVEDVAKDTLGLGALITMKSGVVNHVDCTSDEAAKQIIDALALATKTEGAD